MNYEVCLNGESHIHTLSTCTFSHALCHLVKPSVLSEMRVCVYTASSVLIHDENNAFEVSGRDKTNTQAHTHAVFYVIFSCCLVTV